MLRFLLRRLLLAIPTLLGICLVTFALIHLAPGDPLEGRGQGALGVGGARAAEAARRLYFLDLPLFYNPRPRGLEARVERVLRQLRRGGPRAGAALLECGSACLPGLARAWAQSPAVAALVGRLGQGPRVEQALAGLGTAALPPVMERLLGAGEGPARQAAARVASALTGVAGRLDLPGVDRGQVLASWREWWFTHRRDQVHYSASERLFGRLTETQFGRWLARLLTLRLGRSLEDGRPVTARLAEALPVTVLLSLLSLGLAYLIAVPLGVHAAVRRGSLAERVSTVVVFVLYSLPNFWVAMLLILLLGGVGLFDWFPIYGLASPGLEDAGGWTWLVDRAQHLVLPVICLTYGSLAVISRFQRSAMLDVLDQDYVRTARAKGLSERRVILRHALRNALLPVITLLGLQLPFLISGSVIVERIFNVPGMGLLTFQAFLGRDYPVIMAVSVLAAVLTLLGLILSDLAYALADPRISLERR